MSTLSFHLISNLISQFTMPLCLSHFIHFRSCPLLIFAATWTALLTLTVALASFSPELAFVSAISPSSSFSNKCNIQSSIRLPLDVPGQVLCFPPSLFTKSNIDLIVPPLFAALIVAASSCVLRAVGPWEDHQFQMPSYQNQIHRYS
ncbi:Cortactin-binding protein like [Senna tora]|uniref:Cortactin-binding protein like n=1 Tax=Senna tora TaxID=362788 RepID=A0A834TCF8_9FABA|nr:Cortactin-binding protein like [Senna tora]